ncbi:phospholipid scramblase-related protein [Flavobacterium psychrophilum]|uniref:phospholipid scramblase-related protein n=1 Tax=Flavobacterium psychrophilum TaxID=96345 RepID=UPI0009042D70|nr:phospholipid scramblase-related protein [Flavobacterium psychrophilum]EKT4499321.1 RNAase [Flavobacterium psychrophilum]MBF2092016.1 RNAase [Flavobacterium psychrophilum]OJH11706.1 RNAase [Flavobacterium psychrophilum]SNA77399.1 Scramblase family protein [Flavobacterium psychrophilum]SNA86391.1 Scramblase family protein [Flavobacterium psychrophilum]
MNPLLNQNLFLIKEKVGMFKASNSYDIFDPNSNKHIMTSKEPNLGVFTKIFRFTKYKKHTPFNVLVTTTEGKPILNMKRGVAIFRSDIEVFDEKAQLIGYFKQKFWSFGGKFEIVDKNQKPVCTLQGKWTGWDFKFNKDDKELGAVSKKWAGIGKEFFTSADNYVLSINEIVPQDSIERQLIFAAVMVIDMVLKE